MGPEFFLPKNGSEHLPGQGRFSLMVRSSFYVGLQKATLDPWEVLVRILGLTFLGGHLKQTKGGISCDCPQKTASHP